MLVACSCGKQLRTKAPLEDKRVSHAICNTCLAKTATGRRVLKEMEEEREGGKIEDKISALK